MNYLSQLDAITEASKLAKVSGHPYYAIECIYGWQVSNTKPSLRYGKVFELDENGVSHYA